MNSSALFAKLTNRFPGIIQMVAINQNNPSLLVNSNLSYSRLAVLIKPLFYSLLIMIEDPDRRNKQRNAPLQETLFLNKRP